MRATDRDQHGETQAEDTASCHDDMTMPMAESTTPRVQREGGKPFLVDEDGDRVSVTDAHGTIARFEMSYEPPGPGERKKFGPPMRARIPSAIYLAAAVVFGCVTALAYNSPPNSALFSWAVDGDRIRPISVSVIAVVVLVSALATVIRTQMRGVIVTDDWIEARSLLPLGIPRARRWGWPQVTRIVVDGDRTGLQFYDGAFERLPEVADGRALAQVMMHHAGKHKIDVSVLQPTGRPS
jgi:hypothetical protein